MQCDPQSRDSQDAAHEVLVHTHKWSGALQHKGHRTTEQTYPNGTWTVQIKSPSQQHRHPPTQRLTRQRARRQRGPPFMKCKGQDNRTNIPTAQSFLPRVAPRVGWLHVLFTAKFWTNGQNRHNRQTHPPKRNCKTNGGHPLARTHTPNARYRPFRRLSHLDLSVIILCSLGRSSFGCSVRESYFWLLVCVAQPKKAKDAFCGFCIHPSAHRTSPKHIACH